MSRELTANGWYHGMMPREDIEELLVNEGDFLVRKTEVKGKSKISLGVRYHGSPRHFLFEYENGEWSLKNVKKKSLAELVEHLVKNKTALHSDGCALVTPVPRPDYYILHEDVDIKQKLGRGAFGEVHMGVIKRGNEEIKVAVKKLRGMIGKKQQKAFLKESRIMRRCEHRNVTRLIGVAVQEEPVLIVLELAEFGALNDFLKKNPETPKEKLTDFAKDACRGMTYLSGRDIIHRDLAARNCLLGKDTNGGSVAKISDFGLSVSDADIVQLRQLRSIPVKWCAPETLTKGVYTTKTDVWSFGVLLWEVFTRCATDPYGAINNHDARAKIIAGDLLQTPKDMPRLIANAMELCFTLNPDERPEFETVFRIIAPKEQPPAPDHKFRTY